MFLLNCTVVPVVAVAFTATATIPTVLAVVHTAAAVDSSSPDVTVATAVTAIAAAAVC